MVYGVLWRGARRAGGRSWGDLAAPLAASQEQASGARHGRWRNRRRRRNSPDHAVAAVVPGSRSGIDEFMPEFHFREHHTIVVAAPPARVYAAIKSVSADEIALFSSSPASGASAVRDQRASSTLLGSNQSSTSPPEQGSCCCSSAAIRVVLGAVVVAPPGTRGRRGTFTGADFVALTQPGFGKATMNFRIDDLGNGMTRVETETRVLATGTASRCNDSRHTGARFFPAARS